MILIVVYWFELRVLAQEHYGGGANARVKLVTHIILELDKNCISTDLDERNCSL